MDLAIANKPNGGVAVGKITELNGLEGSGKSLIGSHLLASTQKQDGIAVYIDTESASSAEFLTAIGVDLKTMLYVPLETIEEIFETIETIVENVRKSDKDRLVTIVVDSVMGASTKIEMAMEYDKDGYATSKSIILSKAMRKVTNWIARERICLIFTNQLRTKLGVSFGDPWTTAGGKALPFHSSVRLRLKNTGMIKARVNGTDQVVGNKTNVHVVKNRMGPPNRKIDYEIYYDSGIDNYGGWLNIMKNFKLVSQSGAWYSLDDVDPDTGEVPVDSKGRRSYSTSMSYCPSIKKHVVMGYLPTKIAIPGKPMSLEYFNENGDGVYPMTVQIVGKGSIYDPENKRVRA